MRLILASQSPRRREMLALMGYAYEVILSEADEHVPPCEPGEFVEKLALRKASAVFDSHQDCCVIGADTIVYLDGSIIGKPKDETEAFQTLRLLSGRTRKFAPISRPASRSTKREPMAFKAPVHFWLRAFLAAILP